MLDRSALQESTVVMEEIQKEELFQEYRQRFYDANIAIQQSHFIALASSSILADFPTKLPKDTLERFIHIVQSSSSKGGFFRSSTSTSAFDLRITAEIPSSLATHDALLAPLMKLAITSFAKTFKGPPVIDFLPVAFQQSLAMIVAQTDSFLNDTFKIIFRVEPRKLRRNQKKISWQEVLESGSWDGLISQMVKSYAYELGMSSFLERTEWLSKEVGITLDQTALISPLDEAFQIRHIILHNGGRVSEEFLSRTQLTSPAVGEHFVVDENRSQNTAVLAENFCSSVYIAVGQKFFKKSFPIRP